MKIAVSNIPFDNPRARQILKHAAQEARAELLFNPLGRKLSGSELLEFVGDSEILLAGTEDFDLLWQQKLNLKLIAKTGIGLDGVDFEACKRQGILVTHTPDAPTQAMAELATLMILTLSREVLEAHQDLKRGLWKRRVTKDLSERRIGLFGLGRTGKALLTRLIHLGGRQFYYTDLREEETLLDSELRALILRHRARLIRLQPLELMESSDILSLHLPLYSGTRHILDKKALSRLPKGAILINCARGALVDEEALFGALSSGALQSAGLDVFSKEPPPENHPLLRLPNILLSAHMGSCTERAREAMEVGAAEAVSSFLRGLPPEGLAMSEEERYAPYFAPDVDRKARA